MTSDSTLDRDGDDAVDVDPALRRDLDAVAGYPVFAAYNANVDAIVRVDDDLAAALDAPTDDGDLERLTTTADLAAALRGTMTAGHGNELPMSDDLAAELLDVVEPDEQGLGGQAGLMANVLSVVGAAPVFYTYMLSERQRATFQHPESIRYPTNDGGSLALVPLTEAPVAEATKVNFIFEFTEGTEFHGATATDDTRLIAAMRPERFNLDVGELDDVIDQVGEVAGCALLSGYHSLKREYEDGTGFEPHVADGVETLRRLRHDHEVPVQVEYGVTHYDELRRLIREEIVPEADLVGLDDRELSMLVSDLGLADDVPETGEPAVDAYERLRAVLGELDVDGVRLHATDFFLTATDDYLEPAAIRRGFEFAAVVAAAKASGGRVASPADVAEGLGYPPADDGVAAVDALADHVDAETTSEGSLATGDVVAVPNRVVPNPKGTVGIGDAVAAASFALENALVDGAEPEVGAGATSTSTAE
jgi:ADP-dependent phosphofructokinase/glucokinase